MLKNYLNFVLLFVLIFFISFTNSVSALNSDPISENPSQNIQPQIQIIKGVVKKGNTASSLLNKYLPLKTIYKISRSSSDIFSLTRIKAGQPYKIILQDNTLIKFEYEIDKNQRLVIQKEKEHFSINKMPIEYDVDLEVISFSIENSLFEAVKKSGEQKEIAWKLSDIFAWDIDFIRDIQPGDQFQALVEKKYRDGKLIGYGDIQAAFFTNDGVIFKAFLYKDANGVSGYYDENGRSLQKTFLKAPLSFSKITSRFTKKRLHPILKVYRSHPGVDYAAPAGTPIKTVAEGVIKEIGYNKGMGKYINIRHSNGYITSYNHMRSFKRGMKKNKKVAQGDVIGFVGMTGYATGPHLDFRMQKNGKMVDPLKYKSLPSSPIKKDEMERFLTRTQELSTKILSTHKMASAGKKAS